MVPRPPTLNNPNRRKGADIVVIFGVTARMTLTDSGLEGMSFLEPLIFNDCTVTGGMLNNIMTG